MLLNKTENKANPLWSSESAFFASFGSIRGTRCLMGASLSRKHREAVSLPWLYQRAAACPSLQPVAQPQRDSRQSPPCTSLPAPPSRPPPLSPASFRTSSTVCRSRAARRISAAQPTRLKPHSARRAPQSASPSPRALRGSRPGQPRPATIPCPARTQSRMKIRGCGGLFMPGPLLLDSAPGLQHVT